MTNRMPTSERWCIVRAGGPRTLALASSLCAAGIDAWTPKRTIMRPAPGKRPKRDGKRPMIEVDVPILPTFVFVRADRLLDVTIAAANPASGHPAFSVFRHGGLVPLVADRDVVGLQEEERAAALSIQAQRAAATREEAESIRIGALKTERARLRAAKAAEHERRKALRAERFDFSVGEHVSVEEASAFGGMSGVVVSSDGRTALVHFGGSLTMLIEAWQLSRDAVQDMNIAA